jgi:hypothetical protein
MPERSKTHRPYQVSLRAMLCSTAAIAVALSLFRVAATGPERLFPLTWDFPPFFVQIEFSRRTLALGFGVVILGGVFGAAIGHAIQRDKEGGAIMGVFIGILVSFLGLVVAAIVGLVVLPSSWSM